MKNDWSIVLGSRSPRRKALLSLLVPEQNILVLPPKHTQENFDKVTQWKDVERRVLELAEEKCEDVLQQLKSQPSSKKVLATITADTIVVATNESDQPVVLGQPREQAGKNWQETVKTWFKQFYAGRWHVVMTALCVDSPKGRVLKLSKTEVQFTKDVDKWLDWYLNTEEPFDKAGGYGIQGLADVFVTAVKGSVSNVVGFPLREVVEALQELELFPLS